MSHPSKRQVDSSYEKLPKALRRSTELTAYQKLLYVYMLDKYMFFASKGQEFYESGETLAQEIGATRKTVQNCIDALIERGMLKKTTRQKKGVIQECSYVVPDVYGVFSRKGTQTQEEEPDLF